MTLDIPLHGQPVRSFADRGHIVPVRPKLPAPQLPLDRWLSAKDLPRRDALENLYNSSRGHLRMSSTEQMEMIPIRPHGFHLDREALGDLRCRLLNDAGDFFIQQRLPVFHRKHDVIVNLPGAVRSFPNRVLSQVLHRPESTDTVIPVASYGELQVKAVRRVLENEKDDRFCLRPDFVHGVQMLKEFDFSFHICIYHYQLPGVIELVRQCPAINFVLDHIAKPDIQKGLLEPWRANLRELAWLPNVACKVSGMVTEADTDNGRRTICDPTLSM